MSGNELQAVHLLAVCCMREPTGGRPYSIAVARDIFRGRGPHFQLRLTSEFWLNNKDSASFHLQKFHTCFFVSSTILPFFCSRADTLCSWSDGSVLSRLLLRKH